MNARELRRSDLEGELVDRAGKAERRTVIRVVHAGLRIDPDIEGFVNRQGEGDGPRNL